MHLTVRNRIALAMTALVAANALTAGVVWVYTTRAAEYSSRSAAASEIARLAQRASAQVTQFSADANALALSVSQAQSPEQASAVYGEVMGAETAVTRALEQVDAIASESSALDLLTQWDELRLNTYVWVNAEAAAGGSPLRMTKAANGEYRASISSNITTPAGLENATRDGLRAAVRTRGSILEDATLRGLVDRSTSAAYAARVAEEQARVMARNATLALVLLSAMVAVAASVWLYRTIARPLAAAKDFADKVAAGDLATTFGTRPEDEIGTLISAVEAMKDAVVHRIAVMREMAGAVIVNAEDAGQAARHARTAALERTSRLSDAADLRSDLDDVVARVDVLNKLAAQMLES